LNYWEAPRFKALQRDWYQRLEEEGFRDAEEIIGGDMVLRQNAEHPYRGSDLLLIASKEAYFKLLRDWVQTGDFDSETDRIIMSMVSDGTKQRIIMAELNDMGIKRPPTFKSDQRRCRESIRLTVRKYEIRWGMRKESA
jgi:hypothetical protein